LSTTALFQRIRNVQLRMIRPGTLLPVEVSKYDQRMVLEALHNAIAHQDLRRAGRVLVEEHTDRLVITSEGGFFEGNPEEYAAGGRTPTRYRNSLLAQAMVELGMIDTLGYGIFDMHKRQRHRFLPMPDYDLSEPTQVRLTIHGAIVDEAYTGLLMSRTDLPMADVLALDRVQKGLTIPEATTRRLRRSGLIEGRKPYLRVASTVGDGAAPSVGEVRGTVADDARLRQMVLDRLADHGSATRREVDALVNPHLDSRLDEEQRARKVTYLLAKLRRDGLIRNDATRAKPLWVLARSPGTMDPL
jgi:ATP-dependent DNA helicase RecG